jgi:phosphoribosylanthranilate isomerase
VTPRLKVCCISSPEEAALALRHGADALGLVSHMPSGPGVLPESEIARIAAGVPPGVSRFLLTSHTRADPIVGQQRRCGVDTLQLCDAMEVGAHQHLRQALPGVRLVQVIHVEGPAAGDEARRVAPLVDAILLASGRPGLGVKQLGGTGRTHDWSVSRAIRDAVGVPVFLAGGLTPENVAEAIRRVRPFGLDVCSGLRSEGRLDESRLSRFAAAAVAAG